MLQRTKLRVLSPTSANLPGEARQRSNEGPAICWDGYGTLREHELSEAASGLGRGTERQATARSTGIPLSLRITPGWTCVADGRTYQITRVARTGKLVTLELQE